MIKNFKNSKYLFLITIIIILLLLFNLLAYFVLNSGYLNYIDFIIVQKVYAFSSLYFKDIAIFITDLGYNIHITSVLVILLLILIYYKHYKNAVLSILVLSTSPLLIYFTKYIFHRSRPPLEYRLMYAEGFSYPSGHAFISVTFYGFILYLILKHIKNKYLKWSLSILLGILIFLIGFSRIYLGVHYPSDVIGGYLLGGSWLCFWIIVSKYWDSKTK